VLLRKKRTRTKQTQNRHFQNKKKCTVLKLGKNREGSFMNDEQKMKVNYKTQFFQRKKKRKKKLISNLKSLI
jgi:hypothetical protein